MVAVYSDPASPFVGVIEIDITGLAATTNPLAIMNAIKTAKIFILCLSS
jgi:hypothetical protein